MVSGYDLDLKLAVMGCVVNGPGEAKEADLGIAGGDGCGAGPALTVNGRNEPAGWISGAV